MPYTPPAAVMISETQARRYPDTRSVVAIYTDCAHHQAATCDSCNGLWQLNQLRKAAIGHYPGEPIACAADAPLEQPPADVTKPMRGEHYAFRCPVCHNDLTDLVMLHHDACTTQRGIRQQAQATANA